MRPALFSLICLPFLAGLTACKKEKLDINSFSQCNQSQNLDSTAISAKLIGTWAWSKQSCFDVDGTKKADRNVKVIFSPDGTFQVNENTTALTQGSWMVVQVDRFGSWGLNLSSESEYLYGRLLFCDNQLLFNNSYVDGCDNLFNKSN
jgi:hypothetical protein